MPTDKRTPQGAKPGQYSTPVEADLKRRKILDPDVIAASKTPGDAEPIGLLLALTYVP